MMTEITYEEFAKVELRTGTIVKAELFPEARKPAFKIWVDFGSEIGIKQTSAQVTVQYTPGTLIGKQIIGCINLGTKKIAGFNSEFLLTGFSDADGSIVLISPDKTVPNGEKLH